jgi:tetratricopeptide (TPR) repeat protein
MLWQMPGTGNTRWLMLAVLISAVISLLQPGSVQIISSLRWIGRIKNIQPDEYDRLMLQQIPEQADDSRGCQALWRSRMMAGADLSAARAIMMRMDTCDREDLIVRWKGNLAWLMGDSARAGLEWQALPASESLDWGIMLFRSGDLERSALLIKIGSEDPSLDKNERAKAFQTLGEIYRSLGDWKMSADYFGQAIQLLPGSYYLSFQTAQSYVRVGDCQRAIEVMEAGRRAYDGVFRPQLDIGYALQLGECYVAVGDYEKGRVEAQLAGGLLEKARPGLESGVYSTLSERLENLSRRLPTDSK